MSASAPAPAERASGNGHSWIYWTIGIVVIVLAILGLVTYSGAKDDQAAQQKAQQLTQKLQQAGLPVPDQDILTRTLGSDGGNVCDNPASALGKALLNDQITNGADFVGRRPIIIDRRVVAAEALILQTYCPEKLPQYRDKINKLKTDNTLKP